MTVASLGSSTLDASRFGARAATCAGARLDLGYTAEQDDPAVVATGVALTLLHNGETVEVDGAVGIVRRVAARVEVAR